MTVEFHYLGSAKILGGVGKGLAEAMAELKQLKMTKYEPDAKAILP